jgi:disulfide bond formation protein DsbB
MNVAALTSRVQRSAAHPSFPALAIAGLGIALLAGAYAFEYLGGIRPCPLCLEQRTPWMILIALGGGIFGARAAKASGHVVLGLFAITASIALYGAYLGGFHAGIEYGFWPGPAECSGGGMTLPTEGGIFDGISSSEIVRCDVVAWSLAGVSLAGFNFLFSLAAAALAVAGALRIGALREAR